MGSYYLNARYYGVPKPGIDGLQLEGELEKFDIDYYFVWDESDRNVPIVQTYREVTRGEIPGLKKRAARIPWRNRPPLPGSRT